MSAVLVTSYTSSPVGLGLGAGTGRQGTAGPGPHPATKRQTTPKVGKPWDARSRTVGGRWGGAPKC